jgi:signal transduction histidine kinase
MKIRTKLNITFISTAFILATSLIGVAYFSMVAHFEQQEGNRLKDNVEHSAKAIDAFMFTRVKDFNTLSNSPIFSLSSNEIISDYLSRVVAQYPFYDHMFFVNKNAIIISSSDEQFIGENILKNEPDIEDEFYKTINGGHDDVYISDLLKTSQMEIAENAPLDIELLSDVIDLDGNVIGVLVGFVNTQLINEIVFDIDKRTAGNEYAYLMNNQGIIVISSNPGTEILQTHPDLSISGLQQRLKKDKNGFLIYVNSKGRKVVSGFADLSEYGTEGVGDWILLSTASYNEIMSPIDQMLYRAGLTFSFILVGIFLLIFAFSHTLSKPIIELQRAVTDFRIDSQPIKLKISKNDELGDLYESFNTMTKNLHKSFEERKHAENELKVSEEKLQELNASKDKFFSIIAHDLKSPFNSMLGFSKILEDNFDNYDEENKKKFLEIVHKGLQDTYDLIENLLFWSRSQSGAMDFNPEKLNLYLVYEETIELLKQSAKNKLIKLSNQIPQNIYVNADKYMISTILRNLISNAIKFTPKNGEVSINAELKTYKNNKYAEISIEDNGVGISKNTQSKLFVVGETTSSKGTENETGTGLGLILCKEFVDKHGEKIWVESEVGIGSKFFFTLPSII